MDRDRNNRATLFAIAVLMIFGVLSAQGQSQERDASQQRLTLGVVAGTHQQEVERHFRAFAGYLARQVLPTGVGNVIVAPTASDLAKLLQERKVDFYLESAYP